MSISGLLRNILICLIVFGFAPAWGSQNQVVADFSRGVDGKGVPSGWQLKERIGKANFSVIRDDGKHALRLRSDDASFAFQKPLKVNPRDYPVLSWKWKVTELPEGGDLRNSRTNDQAAQIFIAFSSRKIILYIWDTTAPQGLITKAWAPFFLTVKAIVVRSGPAEAGKWITETRSAYDDYKKLFGKEPPAVAGVRIQINSHHTETLGESFFADMMFKKN